MATDTLPTRNRGGPPTLPPYRRRGTYVIARVTPAEQALVRRQADEAGVSMSELVRSRLLNPTD